MACLFVWWQILGVMIRPPFVSLYFGMLTPVLVCFSSNVSSFSSSLSYLFLIEEAVTPLVSSLQDLEFIFVSCGSSNLSKYIAASSGYHE